MTPIYFPNFQYTNFLNFQDTDRLSKLSGNRRRKGGCNNPELVVGAEWATAGELEKTNISICLIFIRPTLVLGAERATAGENEKTNISRGTISRTPKLVVGAERALHIFQAIW